MNTTHQPEAPFSESNAGNRVTELLAEHLASCWVAWPGTDGLTSEEVVAEAYLAASATGRVPNQAELTLRHPELADAVAAFFARRAPCKSP
jgi:hypothetical protein